MPSRSRTCRSGSPACAAIRGRASAASSKPCRQQARKKQRPGKAGPNESKIAPLREELVEHALQVVLGEGLLQHRPPTEILRQAAFAIAGGEHKRRSLGDQRFRNREGAFAAEMNIQDGEV